MSNDVGEVRRGGRSRKQVDRFEPTGTSSVYIVKGGRSLMIIAGNKGKNKAVDEDQDSGDSDVEVSHHRLYAHRGI